MRPFFIDLEDNKIYNVKYKKVVCVLIRPATVADLPRIMPIYERARGYMAQNGNKNQWINGYPQESVLIDDINKNRLFVLENGEFLDAVFVFFIGLDPTYAYIEGAWKDGSEYGVIHRVASSGRAKGVFTSCLDFCKSQITHIRIDTHKDNVIMQNTLKKHGFFECGIIYLENGAERLAYELTLEE